LRPQPTHKADFQLNFLLRFSLLRFQRSENHKHTIGITINRVGTKVVFKNGFGQHDIVASEHAGGDGNGNKPKKPCFRTTKTIPTQEGNGENQKRTSCFRSRTYVELQITLMAACLALLIDAPNASPTSSQLASSFFTAWRRAKYLHTKRSFVGKEHTQNKVLWVKNTHKTKFCETLWVKIGNRKLLLFEYVPFENFGQKGSAILHKTRRETAILMIDHGHDQHFVSNVFFIGFVLSHRIPTHIEMFLMSYFAIRTHFIKKGKSQFAVGIKIMFQPGGDAQ
jgi:hypothetical protein